MAPLVENANDRLGQDEETHRGRHADKRGQTQGERERFAECLLVPPRGLLRESGKHRGRDGDAEHAEGKLDQPVGVVEVGDASLGQERRDDRVDDRADVGR